MLTMKVSMMSIKFLKNLWRRKWYKRRFSRKAAVDRWDVNVKDTHAPYCLQCLIKWGNNLVEWRALWGVWMPTWRHDVKTARKKQSFSIETNTLPADLPSLHLSWKHALYKIMRPLLFLSSSSFLRPWCPYFPFPFSAVMEFLRLSDPQVTF